MAKWALPYCEEFFNSFFLEEFFTIAQKLKTRYCEEFFTIAGLGIFGIEFLKENIFDWDAVTVVCNYLISRGRDILCT